MSVLLCLVVGIACERHHATESKETSITIHGMVRNPQGAGIYPAYLIGGNRLLAKTNAQGEYAFTLLTKEPSLMLLCSALDYRDTTVVVSLPDEGLVPLDFVLTPDSTIGKVYGEFQDHALFTQAVEADPSMKNWGAKQIFDAATGATMQYKTFGYPVPPQEVYLEDSLLATSDAWGQFSFKLQCGTYPLRGMCEGYQDTTQIVKILPNTPNYVIFFLSKNQ